MSRARIHLHLAFSFPVSNGKIVVKFARRNFCQNSCFHIRFSFKKLYELFHVYSSFLTVRGFRCCLINSSISPFLPRLGRTEVKNLGVLHQFHSPYRYLSNNFYFIYETLATLTDNFGAISPFSETYAHSFSAISIVARK